MAKPLTQIVKDLDKSNDAYHEAVEDLLKSEELDAEQKITVGCDILIVFRKMKEVSKILANYMS